MSTECRAQYTPPDGAAPDARIVRCGLPAGHYPQSSHEETDSGVRWYTLPDPPESVRDRPASEPLDLDAAQSSFRERIADLETTLAMVDDERQQWNADLDQIVSERDEARTTAEAMTLAVKRLVPERDHLAATVERMHPVVEAAVALAGRAATSSAPRTSVFQKFLDAVAAFTAGQPAVGHRRVVDLATVTGYLWTDSATGQQHLLAPDDVSVLVGAAPAATPPPGAVGGGRHEFVITATVRGAGADWAMPVAPQSVYAYSLPEALRTAAGLPVAAWFPAGFDPEPIAAPPSVAPDGPATPPEGDPMPGGADAVSGGRRGCDV